MTTTAYELDVARWESAPTFADWLPTVEKNAELWEAVYTHATVADDFVARVRRLGGPWHLLVLGADWCGDAVNVVPVVQRLVDRVLGIDLRVLDRDLNPDIMDAHLTGKSRSIPVVMMFNPQFRELGWWGPRPSELQAWVLGPGRTTPSDERHREIRRWYARDHGLSTLDEVVAMLERGAAAG